MMSKKIAIVGGTFNPIHNGHVHAMHALYDSRLFDEIWLMPSGTPPFKQEEEQSKYHRLEMCQRLQQTMDFVHVSDIEVLSTKVGYTYNTWKKLKENNPLSTFYWMIGSDHIFQIEQWANAEALLKKVSFVLVHRGGYNPEDVKKHCQYLQDTYDADIVVVPMKTIEISSTDIRNRVQQNLSLIGYTPQCIIDYIYTHNLY